MWGKKKERKSVANKVWIICKEKCKSPMYLLHEIWWQYFKGKYSQTSYFLKSSYINGVFTEDGLIYMNWKWGITWYLSDILWHRDHIKLLCLVVHTIIMWLIKQMKHFSVCWHETIGYLLLQSENRQFARIYQN